MILITCPLYVHHSMNENEKITCQKCQAEIEYERPHFCPYCGAGLDSTQGLVFDDEDDVPVYAWGASAPFLIKLLFMWLGVAMIFLIGRPFIVAIANEFSYRSSETGPLVKILYFFAEHIFSRSMFTWVSVVFALVVVCIFLLSIWIHRDPDQAKKR